MLRGFPAARILPLLAAAAACLTAGAAPPVHAADASAWDNDIRSSARLIAGGAREQPGGAVLRAAVEIKLLPGWKTYWRYPGDSGVPPVFDFTASDNVRNVTVLFPAPQRFPDGAGGLSIGYTGTVTLPLHVVPQDAAKPVTLRMKLDYGACEKLCIPAKAQAELVLSARAGALAGQIAAAEARVPRSARVGEAGPLAIREVRRETGAGKPRIVVEVAAPPGAAVDLFAEGPSGNWALPLPQPVGGAPAGLHRFAFELDGLPPGTKPEGAALRLTAVAGPNAIESEYRLD